MAAASGRKRKTPQDWATEYTDFYVKKMKSDGVEREALVCKYCSLEINIAGKVWDRVHEHIGSKRHAKLKENYLKRMADGKQQLTLYDSEVRSKMREREHEGAVYDFVRAMSYSGVPLFQANTFLGQFVKKYCPALRSMPGHVQLSNKYLVEVYKEHMSFLKSLIADKKFCFIIDESPDVLGRPAVNTLISFYDDSAGNKAVCLVDTCLVKASNSTTLAFVLDRVLREIDKEWNDVIGLASDSTNYMNKLYDDLKPFNHKLLYFNDVCHLIHVAIDFALQCEEFSVLRKIVIKFGAVFKHANKLEQHFKEICLSNGLQEKDLSKPSAVVPIRWYSFFESAQGTLKLWRYLMIFIDHPDTAGEKVTKLKDLLGSNANRQSLYVKLIFVIELLKPIHAIQIILESGEPLLHRMSHIVSINLQMEMTKYTGPYTLFDEVSAVMNILPVAQADQLKADFRVFGHSLCDKWQATCQRSLSPEVSGPNGLWKQALILDPFLKSCQSQTIQSFTQLFELVTDLSSIENEFQMYLLEPQPDNPEITIIQYWHSAAQAYPHLSQAALHLLCISTGSVDVERSFSKLKKIQHPTRSSMSADTLRMQMTLYFNQDIQKHFENYN